MWCRDPRRLRQGMQCLFAERSDRVVDPDRPNHPAASADRHRRARIELLDLFEPAFENLDQRVSVGAHHAVRLEHAAVQLPHPRRVGNLPAEDRATARGVDRLVAERREGENAARRILDRHRSSHHPGNRVRECEQIPDRHAGDPAAAVDLRREPARVQEEPMQLSPGHLLGYGEDRHASGGLHPTQARGIGSALEHDGARLGPFGVQQQLRCFRRPGRPRPRARPRRALAPNARPRRISRVLQRRPRGRAAP